MEPRKFLFEYNGLIGSDEHERAHELLRQNTNCLADLNVQRSISHSASLEGDIECLEILFANGCDFNIPQNSQVPDRPISMAVMEGKTETVRWLIEHGAEVNFSWMPGEFPYCPSLSSAIRANNMEIVRMLVMAGAVLNVADRTNRTPLQWAIDYRKPEIAEYLRSQRGVEANDALGYITPEVKSPLVQWIESRFGETTSTNWQSILTDGSTVPIRRIEQLDCCGYFTDGMSEKSITVPKEKNGSQHVELFLPIGVEPEMADMQKLENAWILEWIQKLARFPFESGTWFEDPVTIVAQDDPPTPLGPGTKMTCWILLAGKSPLIEVKLPDGKRVTFYTMIPIHTKERDFEKKYGAKALLEKFADKQVPEHFVFKRKSVV